MAPWSKEDKILIKMCMNVKATTPPQFLTKFPDKGGSPGALVFIKEKIRNKLIFSP